MARSRTTKPTKLVKLLKCSDSAIRHVLYTVRDVGDLARILAKADPASVERLVDDLHLNLIPPRAVG